MQVHLIVEKRRLFNVDISNVTDFLQSRIKEIGICRLRHVTVFNFLCVQELVLCLFAFHAGKFSSVLSKRLHSVVQTFIMYNEWTSLSPIIAANSNGSPQTVLTKFVGNAGRDVSAAVAKQLASNLGITQTPEPSILLTEDDVSECSFESAK